MGIIRNRNMLYVFAIILCFWTGCATRAVGTSTDSVVFEHQRRIIELENTNRALAKRLGQYDTLVDRTVGRLEVIRGRATAIGDTADRIDYLFSEYERIVQQLIYELRAIGGEARAGAENSTDTADNPINLDWVKSFEDYYWSYMACG